MATTTTPTTGKKSVTRSERVRLRRPLRSYDLHEHLTILFVCGIATVIFTRGFLAATGYPQVGNSKLHIAHVLWGGLLMLSALLALLAFLSPATRPAAAVVGGVGFGLFIDEVGKFVTKDVNYFYKPAIAIIYVAFVVMFGVIRWLSRRGFTAMEATLIGLESLQRSAVGSLSEGRRAEVLHLMEMTGADDPLARDVHEMLEHCDTVPDTTPIGRRISERLAAIWVPLTHHRLFRVFIFSLLVVGAAISTAEGAWLLRHGISGTSFSQRAFEVTTIAADAILVVGAVRLSRSILSALRWYDHAVLLEITVGQVFLYGSEQLAATLNLVALLLVWALIRWAIHFEAARTLQAPNERSADARGRA
ncbi:MAG TPA: hypothetical protein VKR23_11255 [Gaiellaceae bacterium]|nr:hypothetical protein [Gaiellaceae bacterium]